MENKKFDNVLFIGTGGGNDIFSTALAALALRNKGYTWNEHSFAGVLSPFHEHTNITRYCSNVSIVNPNSERYVATKQDRFKIGFVDAAVAKMAKEIYPVNYGNAFSFRHVFGLSLSEGTKGLVIAFYELSQTYDCIVLVDVGGDIFYRGKQDTHVLSPMFDAMVLKAFIDSGVDGMLFEAGPGTDGELDPEVLEEILKQTKAQSFPMESSVIDEWNNLYQTWIAPVRTGRTVPITIEAFNSKDDYLEMNYRARAHIGKQRLYAEFPHRISTRLCKQFFLINPKEINNPFAVSCSSPLDWFIKTQVEQHKTNCEVNLEYFKHDGKLYQFLTPSVLFPPHDRMSLIKKGLDDLISRNYDIAILFPNDWNEIENNYDPSFFNKTSKNNLIYLSF